jgi:hypothetical protein
VSLAILLKCGWLELNRQLGVHVSNSGREGSLAVSRSNRDSARPPAASHLTPLACGEINVGLGERSAKRRAAMPLVEALYVEQEDAHVNRLGVKDLGEIALIGMSPAIANAVFHATGSEFVSCRSGSKGCVD